MLIDLNSDLGEGAGSDAAVIPLITTANVACGFHAAGDPALACCPPLPRRRSPASASGPIPAFLIAPNFGRTEMEPQRRTNPPGLRLPDRGHRRNCQILRPVAQPRQGNHGALYNMRFSSRDDQLLRPADRRVAAAKLFALPLMGIPGTRIESACVGQCPFIAEGFADRRYKPDGTLVPRTDPRPFVEDPTEAVRQAAWLARERGVQTLCVHGDNPRALEFVRALRGEGTDRRRLHHSAVRMKRVPCPWLCMGMLVIDMPTCAKPWAWHPRGPSSRLHHPAVRMRLCASSNRAFQDSRGRFRPAEQLQPRRAARRAAADRFSLALGKRTSWQPAGRRRSWKYVWSARRCKPAAMWEPLCSARPFDVFRGDEARLPAGRTFTLHQGDVPCVIARHDARYAGIPLRVRRTAGAGGALNSQVGLSRRCGVDRSWSVGSRVSRVAICRPMTPSPMKL